MRKIILLLLISILSVCLAFADVKATSSDSMEISAYKNSSGQEEETISNTTLTLRYNGDNSAQIIEGIQSNPFTLMDESQSIEMPLSGSNYVISNLFSISISTRYYKPIDINLKFTPLVNYSSPNGLEKKAVTFIYNNDTSSSYVESSRFRVNSNNEEVSYGGTRYYYRYTPTLTFSEQDNTVEVPSSSNRVEATLTYSTSAKRSTSQNGSYSNAAVPKPRSGDALPGISTNLSAAAHFGISIAKSDYESMLANENYLSTVTIVITPN